MNAVSTNQRLAFSIDGMSCGHCLNAVTQALSTVPSVEVLSVALGTAEIKAIGPSAANDVVAALAKAGYAARPLARPATATTASADTGCCGGGKGCCG